MSNCDRERFKACHERRSRATSGQMAVELAVLIPVIIVVALTVYNLMLFVEACVTFDHIALDAVISQGVSPAGKAGKPATRKVASVIKDALDMKTCTVSVKAKTYTNDTGKDSDGISFPVSPLLTKFTCTLSYHPWPGSFVIAGVTYDSPLVLTHRRTLVVDRYRGGVVV